MVPEEQTSTHTVMRPVTMQQSRTDYIPEIRTRQTNLVRPIILSLNPSPSRFQFRIV